MTRTLNSIDTFEAEKDGETWLLVDNRDKRVGFDTADPKVSLHVVGDAQVSGFCSATNFFGDGSALTNISSIRG